MAIRDAFGDSASHGVVVKTYSVTHLAKDAVTRYSLAAVVAVSTSYIERQNLSLRPGTSRFNPKFALSPVDGDAKV